MGMGGMGRLARVDGRSVDFQVGEIMRAPVQELPAVAAGVFLRIEAFPAVNMRFQRVRSQSLLGHRERRDGRHGERSG